MRSLIIIVVTLEIVVGGALLFAYGGYFGISTSSLGDMVTRQQSTAQSRTVSGRATQDQTVRNNTGEAADKTYAPATFTNDTEKTVGTDTELASIEAIASTTDAAVPLTDNLVELLPIIQALFEPLPAQDASGEFKDSDALVVLGRMLFYDPRLSANQQISCNTCHELSRYGVDNLPVSIGHDGKPTSRNAQTVYNSALHISQFWDGRSPNVEEQSKVPITDASEMGMEPTYIEQVLQSIPGYAPLFAAAFPNEPETITFDKMALAIGAFERRLLTPARFDAFLENDFAQLTPQEQKGLATFVRIGCANCHQGMPVGGLLYKRLGEVEPYQTEDLGRFDVTGEENDRHVFKVPSLRNVAYTGPYLHDGSIQTLEEMVVLMAKHQLGKNVTPEQVSDIVTFLYALTGELPADLIAVPELPANGPNTPTQFN